MKGTPVYYTAKDLAALKGIPDELTVRSHLIYSSPATLAFNSPGAESYGVKRAGLAVPDSVMLIVSPGCCGRNTSSLSSLPEYQNRFFYLTMSETDVITGRHLKKLPEAVKAVAETVDKKPSVVMVCITCVDALLGSDLDRVCRKAEEAAGVKVRPCYMYALTREGSRPPMAAVRQSIYGLLEKTKRRARSINILGYFAPLVKESELYALLKSAGVDRIRQLGSCQTYEDFQAMAEANVNLVLNEEARPAAMDMEKNLGIPSIELKRLYRIEKIHRQYMALASVLGVQFEDAPCLEEAKEALRTLKDHFGEMRLSIGECQNGDPFEMALAFAEEGFEVAEIFGSLNEERLRYVTALSMISPDTRIYMNQSPSMTAYKAKEGEITVSIGKDAAYYHPECPNVSWDDGPQPFGYQAVRDLAGRLLKALSGGEREAEGGISLAKDIRISFRDQLTANPLPAPGEGAQYPRGLRLHLTPFAPDQSGAEEVFFEMGGVSVVLDAGGCTGNICGFDEPRWFSGMAKAPEGAGSICQAGRKVSPVMSAGMRDMDAVLGRDERLMRPLREISNLPGDIAFTALIGTPVPAVIAMDYKAVGRMAGKGSSLPVISVDTDGMEYYDKGVSKAYLALCEQFVKEKDALPYGAVPGRKVIGVWGATPLDIGEEGALSRLAGALSDNGRNDVRIHGYGSGLEGLIRAGEAKENLVVSAAGLGAARWLKSKFGTPYRIEDPLAKEIFDQIPEEAVKGKKVLIVHQQVRARELAKLAQRAGAGETKEATWFMSDPEISEAVRLKEETDFTELIRAGGYDVVFADPVLRCLLPENFNGTFVSALHFAVSGRLH